MNIKKPIILTMLLLNVMAAGVNAYEVPVCVTVNSNYIKMKNEPFLENGVTYVPLRFLSDVFEARDVRWNADTKTATVLYDGNSIAVTENSDIAFVEDKRVKMNGPAVIRNGSMYVPVRFFAESFGADVSWKQKYYRAEITKNDITLADNVVTKRSYDDDHIYWLAKIIHCESEGESIGGKIGVGNVIVNRVLSDEFPDTIYNVIFDTKYGVQFQPVINGTIYKEPGGESYMAAKLVLEGENTAGESLYFLNPRIATNFWIVNNRVYYTSIGKHDFYL